MKRPATGDSVDVRRRRGPGRGLYDRRATPSERAKLQRAALLAGVREVSAADEVLSIAEIARRCGVGRNTFYEHFVSADEALEAAIAEASDLLEEWVDVALSDAATRTPGDVARRLGETLVAFRDETQGRWALLAKHRRGLLERNLHAGVVRVRRVYVEAGAVAAAADRLLLLAAVGALLALVEARDEHLNDGSPADVSEYAALVLSRLLR